MCKCDETQSLRPQVSTGRNAHFPGSPLMEKSNQYYLDTESEIPEINYK